MYKLFCERFACGGTRPPDATDWATYRTHAPFIEIIKAYIRPLTKNSKLLWCEA